MAGSEKSFDILVVNPGSTSTKLACFRNTRERCGEDIRHETADLARFATVTDQLDYRLGLVREFLSRNGITRLHAIATRGGLLHPVKGGVFAVNRLMTEELKAMKYGAHASNLGAPIAQALAAEFACPAYIADPPVVDEMEEYARLSGIPLFRRRSRFHALNQKFVARLVAERIGKKYERCRFIVAHLGGGISVAAHYLGRVIDVNDALDGDGPFSPERSGGVPIGQLVAYLEQNPDAYGEIKRKIVGQGGLAAYLGTTDMRDVEARIAGGDKEAELVLSAMAFQISKEIAMHGATLKGRIDAVIITGGLANDRVLVRLIKSRIAHLGPLHVVPGEREMESLAGSVHDVLAGGRKAQEYK
jgi:butyrate kinase